MTVVLSPSPGGQATFAPDHEQLRAEIGAVHRELAQLRQDVREEVLQQHRTGDWCLRGTNDVLDDLDLPPVKLEFTGQVTVTVDLTVRDASGFGQAEDWVRSALDVTSEDGDVDIADYYIADYDLDQREVE